MVNFSIGFILIFLFQVAYAPVPRCSPFIIINKIPESTSLGADFNPYFPVPGTHHVIIFHLIDISYRM